MSRMTAMSGRRGGFTLPALVAAFAGVILILVAVLAQQSAPEPPRSVGRIDAAGNSASDGPDITSLAATGEPPLQASRPVSISIPSIGVRSKVLPIGLAEDGTLAVPQPGPNLNRAAWFKNSPTPGQPGPSVIEGHVDSEQGPSVFFKLGQLRPGNRVQVTRADGVRAVFTVNAVRNYPKDKFPTEVVYGSEDPGPQLRLITCSNFSTSLKTHTGNEVVFANLTATHRPN